MPLLNWVLRQAQLAGFSPAFPSAAPLDRYDATPFAARHQHHDMASFSPQPAQQTGFAPGFSSSNTRAGCDPVSIVDKHRFMSPHQDSPSVNVTSLPLPSAAQQQPFPSAFHGTQLMDRFGRFWDPSAGFHHSGYDPPIQSVHHPCPPHRSSAEHESTAVSTGSAPTFVTTGPTSVSLHVAGFTSTPAFDSATHHSSADPSSIVDSVYRQLSSVPLLNVDPA